LKNPVDFLRYVKGVVFPGKEFMIEKYGLQSKEQRAKIKDGKKKLLIINSKLLIKFWWLLYPYRWWVALRAIFSGKG